MQKGSIVECIKVPEVDPQFLQYLKEIPSKGNTYQVRFTEFWDEHLYIALEELVVGFSPATGAEITMYSGCFRELLPPFDLELAIAKIEVLEEAY